LDGWGLVFGSAENHLWPAWMSVLDGAHFRKKSTEAIYLARNVLFPRNDTRAFCVAKY
jgi:hypothetical protein